MSRKIQYNDSRARSLINRAKAVLAAATGLAILTATAALGSSWHLSSFHFTLMAVTAALAGLALALLEAARRVEQRSPYAGMVRPTTPPVRHWTGNTPRVAVFVPPALPQPVTSTYMPPVPAPAPIAVPVPQPIYTPQPAPAAPAPAAPAPVRAPQPVRTPDPAPAVADTPVAHEFVA